jgi:protein-tyrosine phosphatase
LVGGADVHVAPDLPEALRSGRIPTLNGSRYFLLEPPHHVVPPRFAELVANLLDIGYVPIITHPERLTWIKTRYELIAEVNDMGCRLQVTADALTGGFGREASALAWRLVEENRVDIVATDSHSPTARPPRLSAARNALAQSVGSAKAEEMVLHRPAAVLANQELPPVAAVSRRPVRRKPWMETLRQFAGIRSE